MSFDPVNPHNLECANPMKIKGIILIAKGDIKSFEPELKLKRKYGKFKREIIKVS